MSESRSTATLNAAPQVTRPESDEAPTPAAAAVPPVTPRHELALMLREIAAGADGDCWGPWEDVQPILLEAAQALTLPSAAPRAFQICKDHENADWNQPALDDDACILCRLFYLEAQESLLEEWQQRAKRAEDALAEVQRPLDAQMARLNARVVELNEENDRLRTASSIAAPSLPEEPTAQMVDEIQSAWPWLKMPKHDAIKLYKLVRGFLVKSATARGSEGYSPITDNDKRWRFLEHGCQWVSWTPAAGETVSFNPRDVKQLTAMRALADETIAVQLKLLRELMREHGGVDVPPPPDRKTNV